MRRPTTVVETKSQRVNDQIRVSPIRVIADDGAQLGILPTEDAMQEARRAGLDLVETERLESMIERWGSRFKNRVFTPLEQAYCNSKAAPHRHYAGRWAVKEAVSKAFGTGITDALAWLDIEVVNDPNSGAPTVRFSRKGMDYARSRGVERVLVSLSHTGDYAAAQAILTGGLDLVNEEIES